MGFREEENQEVRPRCGQVLLPAAKNYFQKRQNGGFIFTTAALIAAGIAAAKAAAIGAATASGALAVNQIAKAAGAGLDPGKIKNIISRVKLTLGDFSPRALGQIEKAQAVLNRNPNAVAVASKILHPVIKTSLGDKLKEYGVMTGSGSSVLFTKHLKRELKKI